MYRLNVYEAAQERLKIIFDYLIMCTFLFQEEKTAVCS